MTTKPSKQVEVVGNRVWLSGHTPTKTPTQARELAIQLWRAAKEADSKQ